MSKGFPCPNCKAYTKWGHFVPPSFGGKGFFQCEFQKKRVRPEPPEGAPTIQ